MTSKVRSQIYTNIANPNKRHESSLLEKKTANRTKKMLYCCRERLLKFVIDEETTSSLSGFLRTSCTSDSVCFADVLPQLAERFPNSKVQLVVVATRAPTVIFASRNGGKAYSQAAVFGLDLVADTSLHIQLQFRASLLCFQNSTILGKVTLSRFHLSKTSGNIGVTDEEVSDLALLSSEMLQKFVNNVLQNGFPVPIPQGMRAKTGQSTPEKDGERMV
uniref:BPI2 domain-containing protein n=1 Tax=Ascaris lumbricoides TaxID=6252 RepID=A0A0M3IRP9_ASCLU